MPFKSKAQRAYLHIHEPEIAARWEHETPKGAKLPEHKTGELAKKKIRSEGTSKKKS